MIFTNKQIKCVCNTTLLEHRQTPEQTQFYNFELPENYLNKSRETLYFEIKSKMEANKPNYIKKN